MKVFGLLFTFVILTAARPDGYSYSEPVTAQHYLPQLSVLSTPIEQFGGANFNSLTGFVTRRWFLWANDSHFTFILQVPGPVETQVHKNIYIYLPPTEPQSAFAEQNIATPTAPQLHYKIIFIKAPSYEQQIHQQVAAAAASQEKTLVYVLVKRPDDIADQPAPSPAEYQPDKPEVYFIKYRTKAGANQVATQSQVQGQFNDPTPAYGVPSINQDPRSSASGAYSAPPLNIALPNENPPQAFW
jgi:Domain of unknown function (DUF243)